jgi:hypothetical protein
MRAITLWALIAAGVATGLAADDFFAPPVELACCLDDANARDLPFQVGASCRYTAVILIL